MFLVFQLCKQIMTPLLFKKEIKTACHTLSFLFKKERTMLALQVGLLQLSSASRFRLQLQVVRVEYSPSNKRDVCSYSTRRLSCPNGCWMVKSRHTSALSSMVGVTLLYHA